MEQRKPQYEVILDQSTRTIVIQSPDGLNERAMRDIGRLQWFAVNHGWELSDRTNENGPFTRATATFLHEEFISACHYFDYCNQSILITKRDFV